MPLLGALGRSAVGRTVRGVASKTMKKKPMMAKPAKVKTRSPIVDAKTVADTTNSVLAPRPVADGNSRASKPADI